MRSNQTALRNEVASRRKRLRSCARMPFYALLAVCLWPAAAFSQSRLEQLESTYQANLRALHAPLLQDYIRQLDLVKSQFIARNRLTDAQQVDAEIARVRTIASTTGVFPYSEVGAAV